jgi:Ca-activated chloride channel homolog
MKIVVLLILSFVTTTLFAQQGDRMIEQGNEYYKQGNYEQAEQQYRKALELDPASTTAQYNLANTLVHRDKTDEAMQAYTELAEKSKDKEMQARSYYNQGVLLSQQKKLEESIEAYKKALRLNPADNDARENLQKALLELKKKNPPKKKEEDSKKKKNDQQQPPKQQPQPKMNPKEAEQKLKLLEQKEKEVQQRLQKESNKSGQAMPKDW